MPQRTLTSFKTELARFRAELAEVSELEPKVDKLHPGDEQHLARWAEDDRADEVWKTIQTYAIGPFPCGPNRRSLEPLDIFVLSVLLMRHVADNIDRTYQSWKSRRTRYLQRAKKAKDLANFYKKISTGAPLTPSVADRRIQLRAEIYEQDAEMMRTLAGRGPKSLRISRIDRKGSRKRVAFMNLVSHSMTTLCGKPLDSVVATLTDIAFPGGEPTSLEQVRNARETRTDGGPKKGPSGPRVGVRAGQSRGPRRRSTSKISRTGKDGNLQQKQ